MHINMDKWLGAVNWLKLTKKALLTMSTDIEHQHLATKLRPPTAWLYSQDI